MTARFRFHEDLAPLMTPAENVRPHPNNVNNGDTDAIIESIQVNGFTAPLLAQRSTGYIVAGNHRYAAALELGATAVPVIWLDMDDEQAIRYMLADNRATRLGSDDLGLLAETLDMLQATEQGLRGSLFTDDYLEVLHESLNDPFTAADTEEYAKQNSGHRCECPRCGWKSGESA